MQKLSTRRHRFHPDIVAGSLGGMPGPGDLTSLVTGQEQEKSISVPDVTYYDSGKGREKRNRDRLRAPRGMVSGGNEQPVSRPRPCVPISGNFVLSMKPFSGVLNPSGWGNRGEF